MKKGLIIGMAVVALATTGALLTAKSGPLDVIDTLQAEDLTQISSTPNQGNEPNLNEAKVLSIVQKLREVEKYNGMGKIAKLEGVTKRQVKRIWRRMQKRLQDLAPAPAPVEHP